jgi:hypothetical protein
MPTLPAELLPLIVTFAPLFSKPVWESAQVLLAGAILALGKRTVTACLRVTGKGQESHFQMWQPQPVKLTCCPTGQALCTMACPRGRFKRECIVDVHLLSQRSAPRFSATSAPQSRNEVDED